MMESSREQMEDIDLDTRMRMVALHWEKYMQHIREKYNSIYKIQIPKVTPHVCRHTFCSNMAKSGMNPKTLQYIMGHSDIGVTLNTYTHVNAKDAIVEMRELYKQISEMDSEGKVQKKEGNVEMLDFP